MNSRNPANRFIYRNGPKPVYLTGPDGQRAFRTVRDKNGDIIRVYRRGYVHRPGAGHLMRRRAGVAPLTVEKFIEARRIIKGHAAE